MSSRDPSIRAGSIVANGSPVPPNHVLNGEPQGGVGAAKDLTQDVERGKTTWEETMGYLKVMEYRYTRFALEPGNGRWAMIRSVCCHLPGIEIADMAETGETHVGLPLGPSRRV